MKKLLILLLPILLVLLPSCGQTKQKVQEKEKMSSYIISFGGFGKPGIYQHKGIRWYN